MWKGWDSWEDGDILAELQRQPGEHGLGTLEGLLGSTAASALLGTITDS